MFGEKPLEIINDFEALENACKDFKSQSRIAVDMEGDSLHHFRERIALIQVSTEEIDYIIDPISCTNLDPFLEIIASHEIQKVMHGSDFDIVSFKRDYNVTIANLFDTLIAASFLNRSKLGLAGLIQDIFGITLDKAYQRHDWSKRPLLPEHIEYARGDTHFLLALHDFLLLELNGSNWLDAVMEESHLLTNKEWNGRLYDGSDFLRTKNAHRLNTEEQKVLRGLWEWRDSIASSLDTPPFKVLTESIMFDITRKSPKTVDELAGIIRKGSKLWRQKGQTLVSIVASSIEDERPLPVVTKSSGDGPPTNFSFDSIQSGLKQWRSQNIENGVPPAHLLSNAQLRSIARNEPRDQEALNGLGSLRNWQKTRYAESLIELVNTHYKVRKKKKRH